MQRGALTKTNPARALKKHFGHRSLRPGQAAVVESLLAGRSAMALFPTGGGKSICYQLPAMLLNGTALVVSPLIALMRDQTDRLVARGIAAARLDSTLTPEERGEVLERFVSGKLRMLYLAPERLLHPDFLPALEKARISLLAVDEAHCIAEWGHNFRPDYLRLAAFSREYLPGVPVLALTASATPAVAAEICQGFGIAESDVSRTSFARPNLRLRLTPTAAKKRLAVLTKKLSSAARLPAIVYVTRQETAEHVATALQKAGITARAYHAGLPDDHRGEAQEAFMSGDCPVMVATVAFGMGIDKADIRSVFHYNLPRSLDHYLQETGRAGRDGRVSRCELLADASDVTALANFTHGDTPSPESLRTAIDALFRQGAVVSVSPWSLAAVSDMRPLVLETLLTHLETEGILTAGATSWALYRVKRLRRPEQILSGHAPEARGWLERLLYPPDEPLWKWITVDPANIPGEEKRVAELLRELETNGDISLRPRGFRREYRLCSDPARREPRELLRRFTELFSSRAAVELARLREMLDFLQTPGCLSARLLARYGEPDAPPCGVCERCVHPDPAPVPGGDASALSTEDARLLLEVSGRRHPSLRHPRQLARFLCGLPSPAARGARLHRDAEFGALRHLPFDEVLTQAEAAR